MKQLTRWIGIWVLVALMLAAHGAARAAERDLDISSSQKDQLKALAANTRDRTGRERDSLRTARTELVQAYSSYTIDWHKLNATWEKISSAQLTLLNIHLDNEIALRNILKAEQFNALRDMMKRHMRDREMLVIVPPEVDILNRLPDKRMLDALGVPADKQKQLENEPAGGKAIQELRESSKQLLDLYSNYTLDSAAARKLIDSVHQKQASLLRQQNHRQRQIRKVLTQDQFQKLQQEVAKRMSEREQRHWSGERGPRAKQQ
jgi:Spy/CpxP family protein refolding chaperone